MLNPGTFTQIQIITVKNVKKNNLSNSRISLSFNTFIKGNLGCDTSLDALHLK